MNKIPEGTKLVVGVAHKKGRAFYNELEESDEGMFGVKQSHSF